MKRIWIYGLLLMAALAAQPEPYELGKLEPVEAVLLYIDGGEIILETDTGARGTGGTLEQALADMKATTAGIVFLDTADYLLVGVGAEVLVPKAAKYLKSSTRVCGVEAGVKVEEAAAFLTVHPPAMTLKVWKKGEMVEKLGVYGGRMFMTKNNAKKR